MKIDKYKYCNSLTSYSRFLTREVKIGDVPLGGSNSIRVQSMTTTDTMNTKATVEQAIRMIDAGCEYVRITAPSLNEAQNLAVIKQELLKRGYKTPLIADIHFTPNAAELAARIVEKVRINPGNYADRKKFENIEYTDGAYDAELERIRNRFTPLVKICKEYGTAMRIGTNHGSLSDRIMSRYGDTPLGMVESALEFVRICEDLGYYDIVLSMKSSNPQVMVHAYRLLVHKMMETDRNYPLHLGVTEAGEGEDGRIKSAVGIGTLLEDGLGDTIRVSLTEDPEFEIPVAKELVDRYKNHLKHLHINYEIQHIINNPINPFEYSRRVTESVLNIGGHNVPVIIADLKDLENIAPSDLKDVGYNYDSKTDKWNIADQACDYIYAGSKIVDFEIPGTLGIITLYEIWKENSNRERFYPLYLIDEYLNSNQHSSNLNFIMVDVHQITSDIIKKIFDDKTVVLVAGSVHPHQMASIRRLFIEMINKNCKAPIILSTDVGLQFPLDAATDCGGLLLDGVGDGILLSAISDDFNSSKSNSAAFGILQATRTRISKTEYISCPSCGRTLFDLQETTAKIRSRTDHLKGVKIAIMGCIVNGPGEMADADYGYVGTGIGKITLYRGKDVVKRSIEADLAVDALIDLIKEDGIWIEKA